MGKRVSAKTLRQRAEAGRGSGEGAEYQGLIGVRDFSSKGYSHRVWGHKSGRMHQFVSNVELGCFYVLDWNDRVTDILDQAALDMVETRRLADQLGYPHPAEPGAGDVPMTTDLVAVFGNEPAGRRIAVAVKRSKDLSSRRVLEKLEIERRYWAGRDVEWQITTERELPPVLIANLGLLYGYRSLERYDVPREPEEVLPLLAYLYDQLNASPQLALSRVCRAADERLKLAAGGALALVWHAVATKRWRVDLSSPLKGHLPLPALALGDR